MANRPRGKSKYANIYKGQKKIETPLAHKEAVAENIQADRFGIAETPVQPMQMSEGARLAEVEEAREELMEKLLKYKEVLNSKVLMANRTQLEKREISALTNAVNEAAVNLDNKNLGEGSMTLNVAALSAILMLHEQVNQLRWLIYGLQKKTEETKETESDDSSNG